MTTNILWQAYKTITWKYILFIHAPRNRIGQQAKPIYAKNSRTLNKIRYISPNVSSMNKKKWGFSVVCVALYLVFCVVFGGQVFVWQLNCLSFYLRLLITRFAIFNLFWIYCSERLVIVVVLYTLNEKQNIPLCRKKSKIPHCRNNSKIPHYRKKSTIQMKKCRKRQNRYS